MDGNLKDAEAALEGLRGRMRRGERVSPSKVTLSELVDRWETDQTGNLRPKTLERYRLALRGHVLPRLGRVRVSELHEDDVAHLVTELRDHGYAAWTVTNDLVALSRVLAYAQRRGLVAHNVVGRLDKSERPKVTKTEARIFTPDEMQLLLAAAGPDRRAFVALGLFAGLRVSETLGLTWSEIDFDKGRILVRAQLGRDMQRTAPKTAQASRDVVLMTSLAALLREHRIAQRHKAPADFVLAGPDGRPPDHRTASKVFERLVKAAGLVAQDATTPTYHDCRHTFASALIQQGADVVFLSRQLGHGSPSITANVYAHEFAQRDHGDRFAEALEARFGSIVGTVLETRDGQERPTAATGPEGDVVDLQAFRQ